MQDCRQNDHIKFVLILRQEFLSISHHQMSLRFQRCGDGVLKRPDHFPRQIQTSQAVPTG